MVSAHSLPPRATILSLLRHRTILNCPPLASAASADRHFCRSPPAQRRTAFAQVPLPAVGPHLGSNARRRIQQSRCRGYFTDRLGACSTAAAERHPAISLTSSRSGFRRRMGLTSPHHFGLFCSPRCVVLQPPAPRFVVSVRDCFKKSHFPNV